MTYGSVSKTASAPPFWVIVGCALAMASGTYLGGWRIIRTLGKGLVEIKSPQGMAAESSSAAIILLSAHFGYALSTTQVCTGSVMGSGLGKPGGEVRWGVAGRMVVAWLVTLPLAGLVGRGHLLDRAPHRRIPRRDHRLLAVGRGLRHHLHPVAQDQGRPQQRQRRVGRQPDRRTRRRRQASRPTRAPRSGAGAGSDDQTT